MALFRRYFVTVDYTTASNPSTCTSSVWISLGESPFRWRNTTIDLWSILIHTDPYWSILIHTDPRTCWTNEAVKEPRNGFFLHGWVSYPNAVTIHNHHKMSLLCHYCVIIVSLLCHYYVIIVSLLYHYYVIIMSLLCLYYVIIVSLLCHYYVIIVSLLCPCGNYFAIMVRTGCTTLQWNILYESTKLNIVKCTGLRRRIQSSIYLIWRLWDRPGDQGPFRHSVIDVNPGDPMAWINILYFHFRRFPAQPHRCSSSRR
jgi:hypothetical protein